MGAPTISSQKDDFSSLCHFSCQKASVQYLRRLWVHLGGLVN